MKLFLGMTVGVLLGMSSTYFAMRKPPLETKTATIHTVTPFKDFDNFRRRMDDMLQTNFNHAFGGDLMSSTVNVKQREDTRYFYYEIEVEGAEKENLNVEVIDNSLEISGHMKESDERGFVSRSFQERLPIPFGVDASRVVFDTNGPSIVVKFPKASAET